MQQLNSERLQGIFGKVSAIFDQKNEKKSEKKEEKQGKKEERKIYEGKIL